MKKTILGLVRLINFLAFIALLLFCIIIFYIASGPELTESGSSTIDYLHHKVAPESVELPIAESLTQCDGAPFVVPTDGWIGVLYADSILGTTNHSGLDIFGLEGNGVTPVYAAYDGYLTRLPEWTSAVIIRHPQDPLNPDRQIWTYYTHLADADGNVLARRPFFDSYRMQTQVFARIGVEKSREVHRGEEEVAKFGARSLTLVVPAGAGAAGRRRDRDGRGLRTARGRRRRPRS